jgi:hypothetical protein
MGAGRGLIDSSPSPSATSTVAIAPSRRTSLGRRVARPSSKIHGASEIALPSRVSRSGELGLLEHFPQPFWNCCDYLELAYVRRPTRVPMHPKTRAVIPMMRANVSPKSTRTSWLRKSVGAIPGARHTTRHNPASPAVSSALLPAKPRRLNRLNQAENGPDSLMERTGIEPVTSGLQSRATRAATIGLDRSQPCGFAPSWRDQRGTAL